jgi:predicted dehydrogenase
MGAVRTLAFLEPGHFHAALVLRQGNPRVSERVHLYATPGPERDAFVGLVEDFNARADSPTRWQLAVHEGREPLAALVADGHADAVVLAGRNHSKLGYLAALHAAGIPVLADKPWLTDPAARDDLLVVTDGAPLVMDIMTERHSALARLRAAVVAEEGVFGDFACDDAGGPAMEIGSVHHLYKRVNGVPLRRPAWYYDTDVQGDGVVDIQSHMTDQMQWLVAARAARGGVLNDAWRFEDDVSALQVECSTTPVPLDLFRDSTGLAAFPPELAGRLDEGVLQLACNSEIRYRLRGVPVRQSARWGQREPEGSGDLHAAHLRGSRCEVILRFGPETGFRGETHLRPRPGVDLQPALDEALRRWQEPFPGLTAQPSELGVQLVIPHALHIPHEGLFPIVLESFLDHLDSGEWPQALARRIRMRYLLLAAAKERVGS